MAAPTLAERWAEAFAPIYQTENMPAAIAEAIKRGLEPGDCTNIQFSFPGHPELEPSLWFGQWQDPHATYWIVTPHGATQHQGRVW